MNTHTRTSEFPLSIGLIWPEPLAVNYLDDPLVQTARQLAHISHYAVNHLRRYTGEPYITHLAAVVKSVASVPHTPHMLAAAWLHDYTDTKLSLITIEQYCGAAVAHSCASLAPTFHLDVRPRSARMSILCDHYRAMAPSDQTVKIADILHNVSTIAHYDPAFAGIYLPEKARELSVLTRGDTTLLILASEALERALRLNA